ncbi:MAG TPA: glycosyltransferase family 39 protein [Vicinamibacterales bacterium]|nr:glycosyltransferase family 39 protein [Vicinamibacterales bacterium]
MARRTRRSLLLPIALAGCFAVQCLWFIGTQSLTYDEPAHLIAGLDAWRHRRFEQWNDQPPLGRLLLTAPLLFPRVDAWQLDDRGPSGANYWTVAVGPDAVALAWRTRLVNVALGLLLATLLWFTARRYFSEGAANVALALFACSPAAIAHFSLATVDGLAALTCFAAAVAVVRWRAEPTWARTSLAGLAFGAFLTSKFSAPPLVLLGLALMATSGSAGERRGRIAKTCVAVAIAAGLVWTIYGWRVGPVTFRNGSLSGPYARGSTVIVPTDRAVNRTLSLPAPEFVAALGGVAQHSVRGQPAFLLGEVKHAGGWRRYFPIVVLLKWPLAVWLLAIAAVLAAARRLAMPRDVALLMLFPLLFFALAISTKLDIGDRYVLPAYPFLLLLCAAAWHAAGVRPLARGLVVALVAFQAVDVLRYAPDQLSYMTIFVPQDRGYTLLTDSNLDWGQGLLALRDYERGHPAVPISLAYFGGVDPRSYGIAARSLGEQDRVHGTVVVSATHLSGQYLHDPAAYHWLLAYPRTAVLDHTLHVFEVP